MGGILTDVTPVLMKAFPRGKPEMSAADFDKALSFVKGRRAGTIPKPGPLAMDYAWWAHTMVVEWRMLVEEWEKNGKKGLEPKILLCPECNVMLLLDLSAADVLICPGGCHRAITVATFVQLFKRPAAPRAPMNQAGGGSSLNNAPGRPIISPNLAPTIRRSGTLQPTKLSLSQTVPKGSRPEDYGITEGIKKGRDPLVGWRMWNLVPGAGMRLTSLNSTAIPWEGGVPMQGTCNGRPVEEILDHTCPSWEHRCGVHAVKDLPQIKKWGAPKVSNGSSYVRVIGEIELWGRVLEYEEGFRAEWGYPKKLYLPDFLPNCFAAVETDTPEKLADYLWSTYLTETVVDQDVIDIP